MDGYPFRTSSTVLALAKTAAKMQRLSCPIPDQIEKGRLISPGKVEEDLVFFEFTMMLVMGQGVGPCVGILGS